MNTELGNLPKQLRKTVYYLPLVTFRIIISLVFTILNAYILANYHTSLVNNHNPIVAANQTPQQSTNLPAMLTKMFLLNRLRRAIRKVRFLLNFSMNKWRIGTMNGSSSRRRMSYKEPPGLLDCTIEWDQVVDDREMGRSSPAPMVIQRLPSDDIDRRADAFIANFYERIRMERQVSLQLRYLRGISLERALSD